MTIEQAILQLKAVCEAHHFKLQAVTIAGDLSENLTVNLSDVRVEAPRAMLRAILERRLESLAKGTQ